MKNNTIATDHLGNEYKSLTAMCNAYDIPRTTYIRRLERGWEQEAALTTPLNNTVPGVCAGLNEEEKQEYYKKAHVASVKAYYEANKEKIAAQKKSYNEAYYKEHEEEIAARSRAYYEANKEKEAARSKRYRDTHKEMEAARCKAYRESHKEEINRKQRERYAARKAAAAI